MGILENKKVIIIGASGGIGAACAEEFLAEGAIVSGSYRRENEKLGVLKEKYGERFTSFRLDLGDQGNIGSVIKDAVKELGGIDALVNGAGILQPSLLHMAAPDNWEETIKTNLFSAFHIMQSVIVPMISGGGGSVVQVSSLFGLRGGAGQASYCASKAGLIGMVKSAAVELAARGIRVNAVAPGLIDTEMTDRMLPKYREQFLHDIPMHRPGTAREVAQACVFLASDKSSYITGQALVIDGGWHAGT